MVPETVEGGAKPSPEASVNFSGKVNKGSGEIVETSTPDPSPAFPSRVSPDGAKDRQQVTGLDGPASGEKGSKGGNQISTDPFADPFANKSFVETAEVKSRPQTLNPKP